MGTGTRLPRVATMSEHQTAADDPQPHHGRWRVAYFHRRYAALFYSLLLTMAASPALATLGAERTLLQFVLAANLVAGVLGLPKSPRRSALLVLTALLVAVIVVPARIVAPSWSTAAFAFWSVIALLAAADAVRFVLHSRTIETEHVYAALSVYLLAGMFVGVLHWCVEQAWPGSYAQAAPAAPLELADAIYFSFVTLSSLGYGDIVPVSDAARGLSVVEVVGGQLYLAVMIARLVGAHLQSRTTERSGG